MWCCGNLRSFADLVFLFCCCFADLVFLVLFCFVYLFVCYSGVEGVLAIQKQFWIHISVKHCALAQSPYQSAVLTSATA